MKTKVFVLLGALLTCNAMNAFGAGGSVIFNNRVVGQVVAPISDVDGTLLSGTNFWAQLYSADGLTATADQLVPAGVSVNFRTGAGAGFVQSSADVMVTSVNTGPASVQIRAWAGPFTTYEGAKNGGGRFGESRILRFSVTGGVPPGGVPIPSPVLADGDGPVNSFSLVGPPVLTINDIVVAEGTNGTVNAVFTVLLLPAASQTVTVDYATLDGAALAGSDYVATNGTLTFLAGETNKSITVVITPDVPPEPDEDFSVILTNPVNALFGRSRGTCTITEVRVTGISVDVSVSFNTVPNRTYVVERADSLGSGNWTPVTGAGNVLGTGAIVTVVDKGAGCNSTQFYRARLLE